MSAIHDIIMQLGYTPTQMELAKILFRQGIKYRDAKHILWELSVMRKEKLEREAVLKVWPGEGQ
jgi:hypothetical protein